jgi:hypothetical protein
VAPALGRNPMNEVIQVGGIVGMFASFAFLWNCRERWARVRPSRVVAEALAVPVILGFLVPVIVQGEDLFSGRFWYGHGLDRLGVFFFAIAGTWLGGVALVPALVVSRHRRMQLEFLAQGAPPNGCPGTSPVIGAGSEGPPSVS